ncbi:hypothetical protein DOK78_001310 [Enterococcus sp. DIV2402]|uniref:DUF1934 domain-containing protein n=1 Tax=Candidatus Enterococcus lowellii TaxID=2230877 RepID=A0ABZ2SMF8_9ENTE|nr:DUF1934 domain-containing protein [Enterococcus sp. DIV2402]
MDLTKGIPVAIRLKTEVTQNNELQEFLFELSGQVVKMGDTLYIRYKEVQEDQSEVPVTMKLSPDGTIQLIRSGEMRLRLKFVYREKADTSYQTPYGVMFFSTYTNNLHFSLKDQPTSGKVSIDYDLFTAGDKIGEYKLSLEFTA